MACEKALLVLDDLGREGDTQIRRADIGDIISTRYDAKLPTIITTELTFSDVIKTYGLSAAHKLAEDSEGYGGIIADCGDESVCPANYDGDNRGREIGWEADKDEIFGYRTGREDDEENESCEPEDVD